MYSSIQAHVEKALQGAPILTYGGTGSAAILWGLHITEIGVILSVLASFLGVGIQLYVAIRNTRADKRAARLLQLETAEIAARLKRETGEDGAID